MTVSSTTRKAGPFTGTGATSTYPFTFKVFTTADVQVVRANASGVETTLVLNSDYTVSLNADQDNTPGGSITLTTALASGYLLVIVGDLAYSQGTDLPTGGAFNAVNVEDALDRLTMLCQQLREITTRAVSVGPTSAVSGDQLLTAITQAVSDSAASAASALLSLNTFQAQYYGVRATDPTLDPLGNAMTQGDLYFSSALLRMRAYTGSAWADVGVATPVTVNVQRFSGTGAQTVFTLSNAPAFQNACEVAISGITQVPGVDYTVTGAGLTTLTFTVAPPAGTNSIFTRSISAYAGGVPNDGSVTSAKMAAGAATGAALGADVVQTSGAQAIAGVKTFSSQPVLSAGAQFPDATQQNTAFVGAANAQVFTSSGTFTVPTGITKVRVTVFGGGGGGSTATPQRGGIGGSGVAVVSGLTPGAAVTVTVGAGGAGGNGAAGGGGVAGGTSSFGAYASGTGGAGATSSVAGAAGTFTTSGVLLRKGVSAYIGGADSGGNGGIATCSYAGGGGGAGMSGGGGGAGSAGPGSAGLAYGPGANGNIGGNGLVFAGGAGGGASPGAGGTAGTYGGGGGGGTGGVIVEW